MSRAALAALAALALAASSCGATDANGGVDAGSSGDGGSGCEMVITVLNSSPITAATIDVDGSIDNYGSSGFEEFAFAVTLNGVDVVTSERTPFDGSKISFVANQPGPYRVELRGSVGASSCIDALATVNVSDPGAATRPFRFRFAPALGQAAPPQDKLLEIPGGADYSLGTVSLDPGLSVSGIVSDGSDPVAAYLRFTSTTDGSAVETFSDATGAYATRLIPGSYTSLVVPQARTASAYITDRSCSAWRTSPPQSISSF